MRVWVIEVGEPLPVIENGFRDFRCGMLAKTLASHGHQVTWWASTFDHFRKRHRFDSPRTLEAQSGLEIRFLHGPGYSRNASPKRFLHNRIIASSFESESLRASNKPDVVFCCLPTLELSEKAVELGSKTGIPVLIDIRDLWPDHYLTLVPRALRGVLKLALISEFRRVRRLLAKATGITAISNTFLKWALSYAGRTKGLFDGVFPMGYPTIETSIEIKAKQKELASQYRLRSDDFIVSFVGTFCSSYDLETVIETARAFAREGQSDIRFVIIGDGDNSPQLRARAQGIANVVFTGWFDQVSIAAVLGLSSVGLAPYRDDASMSLPNKPFEYLAMGLPLLSSLRGELETLIRAEQIGLQYQTGDVTELMNNIRWLMANPNARQEMGRRARELFEERFSADIIYPRLTQHLEWVARERDAIQEQTRLNNTSH